MGDGGQPDLSHLENGTAAPVSVMGIDTAVPGEGGDVKREDVRGGAGPRDAKTNGVVVTHEEHLPQGIQETEEELKHGWFVGSIDQGTTSSRFLIFNGEGDPVVMHQIEFENLYPKSGYFFISPLPPPG